MEVGKNFFCLLGLLGAFLFLSASWVGRDCKKTVLRCIVVVADQKDEPCGTDGAITDDLKHILATQAAPVIVVGFPFENIVRGYSRCVSGAYKNFDTLIEKTIQVRRLLHQKPAGWRRQVQQTLGTLDVLEQKIERTSNHKDKQAVRDDMASYFTVCKVGAPGHVKSFDQNWLTFQLSGHTAPVYLLIPRRYLEYIFDVNFDCCKKAQLSEVITDMCTQHKLYGHDVYDVVKKLGFDVAGQILDGASMHIVHLNDVTISKKDFSKQSLSVITKHVLSTLIKPATSHQSWCLKWCGHGGTVAAGYHGDTIAGIKAHHCADIIEHVLAPKGVGLLAISSCFAGGGEQNISSSRYSASLHAG